MNDSGPHGKTFVHLFAPAHLNQMTVPCSASRRSACRGLGTIHSAGALNQSQNQPGAEAGLEQECRGDCVSVSVSECVNAPTFLSVAGLLLLVLGTLVHVLVSAGQPPEEVPAVSALQQDEETVRNLSHHHEYKYFLVYMSSRENYLTFYSLMDSKLWEIFIRQSPKISDTLKDQIQSVEAPVHFEDGFCPLWTDSNSPLLCCPAAAESRLLLK